jgi:ornithine cyclodeaminase/alanine dehydrogenase-like protein (mu-crystallin family)
MTVSDNPPPRYVDAATITACLPPEAAVEAVLAGLRGDVDPAADVPRLAVPLQQGDLLLMPAQSTSSVGVKLATVAPGNPARGLPRISAAYVLFDAATLRPTHLLDGVALTNLRTPAVSVAAVKPWLDLLDQPLRVVAFGGGPQSIGHLETVAAVHDIATSAVVVRQPDRVRLPESLSSTRVLSADDASVSSLLGEAHLIVCATTARTPLFDSTLLGDRTIVVAVGSHEAEAREVDAAFCARACVIVEDRQTALRECGDVIQAIAEDALSPDDLVPLRKVARADRSPAEESVFFKGSGMSWEDLVVAEAVLARL